jgi:putative FmdB family regulatory protein
MPLYEYECESCGKRFEKIQKFSDPLVDVCPNCGKGPVKKLLSSPAIQFKGSGWYITDYPKKSTTGSAKDTRESRESRESKDTKDTKETKETSSGAETKTTTSTDKKD